MSRRQAINHGQAPRQDKNPAVLDSRLVSDVGDQAQGHQAR
jgi:hypothetical protein